MDITNNTYLRAVLVLSMVDEYLCAGVAVAVQQALYVGQVVAITNNTYLRAVLVLSMVDEYLCAGVSVAVQ